MDQAQESAVQFLKRIHTVSRLLTTALKGEPSPKPDMAQSSVKPAHRGSTADPTAITVGSDTKGRKGQ